MSYCCLNPSLGGLYEYIPLEFQSLQLRIGVVDRPGGKPSGLILQQYTVICQTMYCNIL